SRRLRDPGLAMYAEAIDKEPARCQNRDDDPQSIDPATQRLTNIGPQYRVVRQPAAVFEGGGYCGLYVHVTLDPRSYLLHATKNLLVTVLAAPRTSFHHHG